MPDETAPRAPGSSREIFMVFTRLALQGFGGVLPVAQRELVERERWLSREHSCRCSRCATLTLLAVGWLRWPLVWVVLALRGVSCTWAWGRLRPVNGQPG